MSDPHQNPTPDQPTSPYAPSGQPAASPYAPSGQPAASPYAPSGQPAASPYAPQPTAPQYGAPTQPYGATPPPYAASPDHGAYAQAPQGYYPGPGSAPQKTSGLAIAALVVGILSLVFCWVPVAGAIGGVVAVVLGILGMRKATGDVGGKGLAVGGLVTGALAFLVGAVVSVITFVAIGQVNQAAEEFNESLEELEREASAQPLEPVEETEDSTGTTEETAEETADEPAAGALGTRENPAQPGTDVITFSDGAQPLWEVTVGAATWDAWATVQAENQFNTPPAAGNVHVMLPVTATYQGPETGTPAWDLTIQFVAADGRTFDQAYAVIPNDLTTVSELYAGGVGTGNVLFEIPADAITGGTWSVEAGFFSDTMFFAAV